MSVVRAVSSATYTPLSDLLDGQRLQRIDQRSDALSMVDRAERRKPFARARFGKRPKRARGELLRQLVVVRRTGGVATRAAGPRPQGAAVSQADRDARPRERRRRP